MTRRIRGNFGQSLVFQYFQVRREIKRSLMRSLPQHAHRIFSSILTDETEVKTHRIHDSSLMVETDPVGQIKNYSYSNAMSCLAKTKSMVKR